MTIKFPHPLTVRFLKRSPSPIAWTPRSPCCSPYASRMSAPEWPPLPSHREPVIELYCPVHAVEYQVKGSFSLKRAPPSSIGPAEYRIGPATGGTKDCPSRTCGREPVIRPHF